MKRYGNLWSEIIDFSNNRIEEMPEEIASLPNL